MRGTERRRERKTLELRKFSVSCIVSVAGISCSVRGSDDKVTTNIGLKGRSREETHSRDGTILLSPPARVLRVGRVRSEDLLVTGALSLVDPEAIR